MDLFATDDMPDDMACQYQDAIFELAQKFAEERGQVDVAFSKIYFGGDSASLLEFFDFLPTPEGIDEVSFACVGFDAFLTAESLKKWLFMALRKDHPEISDLSCREGVLAVMRAQLSDQEIQDQLVEKIRVDSKSEAQISIDIKQGCIQSWLKKPSLRRKLVQKFSVAASSNKVVFASRQEFLDVSVH
jgi:hypothetical protein